MWNLQKNMYVLIKKMFKNELNMGLPWWAQVKKTVHGMKTYRLSGKEKIPDTAVNKDDTNSFLEYERTHHYWFPWKKYNCKQCFLMPTLDAKFALFIEWSKYIVVVSDCSQGWPEVSLFDSYYTMV